MPLVPTTTRSTSSRDTIPRARRPPWSRCVPSAVQRVSSPSATARGRNWRPGSRSDAREPVRAPPPSTRGQPRPAPRATGARSTRRSREARTPRGRSGANEDDIRHQDGAAKRKESMRIQDPAVARESATRVLGAGRPLQGGSRRVARLGRGAQERPRRRPSAGSPGSDSMNRGRARRAHQPPTTLGGLPGGDPGQKTGRPMSARRGSAGVEVQTRHQQKRPGPAVCPQVAAAPVSPPGAAAREGREAASSRRTAPRTVADQAAKPLPGHAETNAPLEPDHDEPGDTSVRRPSTRVPGSPTRASRAAPPWRPGRWPRWRRRRQASPSGAAWSRAASRPPSSASASARATMRRADRERHDDIGTMTSAPRSARARSTGSAPEPTAAPRVLLERRVEGVGVKSGHSADRSGTPHRRTARSGSREALLAAVRITSRGRAGRWYRGGPRSSLSISSAGRAGRDDGPHRIDDLVRPHS